MSSNSGNNNSHFTSYIGRPVVHCNTKCPLISSLELFISQTWICGESLELFPEFNSDVFGKVIQSFQNDIGNDDINTNALNLL